MNMINSFIKKGGRKVIKLDYKVMPFRSDQDFLGTELRLAALNTWSFGAVAPITFVLKWRDGRPRAEVHVLIYHLFDS
jgi:hypothetical protein